MSTEVIIDEVAFGTRDVARVSKRSMGTVRRWIKAGKLPRRRVAGGWFGFTRGDIEKLLRPSRTKGRK